MNCAWLTLWMVEGRIRSSVQQYRTCPMRRTRETFVDPERHCHCCCDAAWMRRPPTCCRAAGPCIPSACTIASTCCSVMQKAASSASARTWVHAAWRMSRLRAMYGNWTRAPRAAGAGRWWSHNQSAADPVNQWRQYAFSSRSFLDWMSLAICRLRHARLVVSQLAYRDVAFAAPGSVHDLADQLSACCVYILPPRGAYRDVVTSIV